MQVDNYLRRKLELERQLNRSVAVLEFERKLEEARKVSSFPERIDALLRAYREAKEKRAAKESVSTESPKVLKEDLTQPAPSVKPSVEELRERVRQFSGESTRKVEIPQTRTASDEASMAMRRLLEQARAYSQSRQQAGLIKPEPTRISPPPPSQSQAAPQPPRPVESSPGAPGMQTQQPVAQRVTQEDLTEPRVLDPNSAYISGVFGEKRGGRVHSGVDVAAMPGTLMPSPASGYVEVGYDPGYGKFIRIIDPDRPEKVWILGHVDEVLVQPGTFVTIGQPVATPGTEGNVKGSYPYHIHYEVRVNGTPVDPISEHPAFFAPLIPRVEPYLPDFSLQAFRRWLAERGG